MLIRLARFVRAPRDCREGGFTLIEVVASLFIFTLLTLGLVPLLTTSIRGSNTARADTIGKNAALKAMERVRGLPFFVSYATSTTKVDLLDLYYPDAATDIVVGGRTLYRKTCVWNALTDTACPRDLPQGYTVQFDAQFVDIVAGGTQPAVGETATSYTNVPPASTYRWNSASTDTPPRQILQMTITTTWTASGTNESYVLTSLISDRSFGGRRVKADATLGYGVDVYAFFDTKKNASGNLQSSENLFMMTSESEVEGRRLSTARQNTTAARVELERDTGGSLATLDGATSSTLLAPPDQTPATITATTKTLTHPDFAALTAGFGATAVSGLSVVAASATPTAGGDTEVTAVIAGTSEYMYMKDPQLNNGDYNALNLDTQTSGLPPSIVSLVSGGGLAAPLPIAPSPATTGKFVVGGTRTQTLANSVHSQATTGFDRMLFLRSNWIPNPGNVLGGGTLAGQGAIVVIDDFQAATVCDSNTNGTGSGEAQYQATIYVWEDPVDNGNRTDGRYRPITLNVTSSSAAADPLAAIKALNSNNGPLTYDAPGTNNDIYLFGTTLGKTIGTGGQSRTAAFLKTWSSVTRTNVRVDASTDATGAAVSTVNSSIDGAIEIQTADLDTTIQVEALASLSLGSLSCTAEDAR